MIELSRAQVKAMIADATADRASQQEQVAGFYTKLRENLELPFEATDEDDTVLIVEAISLNERGIIVAEGTRNSAARTVSLRNISLPEPPPKGTDWILAYRHWAQINALRG